MPLIFLSQLACQAAAPVEEAEEPVILCRLLVLLQQPLYRRLRRLARSPAVMALLLALASCERNRTKRSRF